MNNTTPPLTPHEAFYHGAQLTFLDGLGCSGRTITSSREEAFGAAETALQELLLENGCNVNLGDFDRTITADDDNFGIYPFFIKKGS